MDDRQRAIREGAGLEESRLNQEFIEFLQKWSMPLLVVIAAVAVGYAAWGKVKQARTEKLNTAFRELESASGSNNPSPDSLRRVADEYEGERSVPAIARLEAAKQYMRTVRSGIRPGSEIKPDGTLAKPEDTLNEQDIAQTLAQAKNLFQRVYDDTAASKGRELLTIEALYGLAAVAESKKDTAEAKSLYLKLADLAEKSGYKPLAEVARSRIANLDTIVQDVVLYSRADLPIMPWEFVGPPEPPPEAPTPPKPDPTLPGAGQPPEPAPAEPSPAAPGDPKPNQPAPEAAPAPTPAPTDPPK